MNLFQLSKGDWFKIDNPNKQHIKGDYECMDCFDDPEMCSICDGLIHSEVNDENVVLYLCDCCGKDDYKNKE